MSLTLKQKETFITDTQKSLTRGSMYLKKLMYKRRAILIDIVKGLVMPR